MFVARRAFTTASASVVFARLIASATTKGAVKLRAAFSLMSSPYFFRNSSFTLATSGLFFARSRAKVDRTTMWFPSPLTAGR